MERIRTGRSRIGKIVGNSGSFDSFDRFHFFNFNISDFSRPAPEN
jgi:hypothetical protein